MTLVGINEYNVVFEWYQTKIIGIILSVSSILLIVVGILAMKNNILQSGLFMILGLSQMIFFLLPLFGVKEYSILPADIVFTLLSIGLVMMGIKRHHLCTIIMGSMCAILFATFLIANGTYILTGTFSLILVIMSIRCAVYSKDVIAQLL